MKKSRLARNYEFRKTDHVQPNDVIEVLDDWFRVRYITRHMGCTTLHLQRESEPLSPFTENDVISLQVSDKLDLGVNVEVPL